MFDCAFAKENELKTSMNLQKLIRPDQKSYTQNDVILKLLCMRIGIVSIHRCFFVSDCAFDKEN